MLTIRRAKLADAKSLAPRVREADRNECRAYLGMEPEVVLPMSIADGPYTWVAVDDQGVVQGMFGVGVEKSNPHFGLVWMCTTNEVFKHRRELVRLAPKWLARMHRVRPLLGNHIDARNTVHVRWLKRMGFSFMRTLPRFGAEGRPFHEFARLRTP